MIHFLVALLIFMLVCGILYALVTAILALFPVPEPWKRIVLAIFALILLLLFLAHFGIFGHEAVWGPRYY